MVMADALSKSIETVKKAKNSLLTSDYQGKRVNPKEIPLKLFLDMVPVHGRFVYVSFRFVLKAAKENLQCFCLK